MWNFLFPRKGMVKKINHYLSRFGQISSCPVAQSPDPRQYPPNRIGREIKLSILASRTQLRASFIRWALFFVPVVVLLGFLSGKLSGSSADSPWFSALVKPDLYPPAATFGIAWTVLYIMIGLAAALVASAWGAYGRLPALIVFVLQLALNLAWSPVFFSMHRISGALYLIGALDVLVLVTVFLFWRVRWQAGALLLPYVAWLAFATFLNWQVLELNPYLDGVEGNGAVQRFEL